MKTILVACDGSLSVAAHLAEMRAWLSERNIVARELTMLHVANFRIVFRASFDSAADADRFATQFG